MSVLAVYGPVEGGPTRASFLALDGPLQAALAAGTGPAADVFMAGDFNCTLPTPGVTTSFGGAVRAQCAEQLQALVAAAGLVDVWASLASQGVNLRGYKEEDAWTHISNTANGISAARLYIGLPRLLLWAKVGCPSAPTAGMLPRATMLR